MRVDRVPAPPTRPAVRPAPGSPNGSQGASASFAGLLEEAAAAPAEVAQAMAPDAVIVATTGAEAVAADRQARRHARAMLQALGALQLAVLGGTAAAARAQLAALAGQPAQADDPVLRLILREIGARAAVELARGET